MKDVARLSPSGRSRRSLAPIHIPEGSLVQENCHHRYPRCLIADRMQCRVHSRSHGRARLPADVVLPGRRPGVDAGHVSAPAPAATTTASAPATPPRSRTPAPSTPPTAPAAAPRGAGGARGTPAPAAPAGDGAQAAAALGWGPVLAGDEFSYTGAPDATKMGRLQRRRPCRQGRPQPSGVVGGQRCRHSHRRCGRNHRRDVGKIRPAKVRPLGNPHEDQRPRPRIPPGAAVVAEQQHLAQLCRGGLRRRHLQHGRHEVLPALRLQRRGLPGDGGHANRHDAVAQLRGGVDSGRHHRYIDGVQTFTDKNPAHQPTVGMHQTMQLDWFPDGTATSPSQMQVDWVRVYQ